MSEYLIFGGLVLVVALAANWLKKKPKQMDQALEETLVQLATQQLIVLDVEVVNEMYLCYDHLTKEFVCQGNTMKEISDRFYQRYPDKEAALYHRTNSTVVATLSQQLKELHENRNRI